MHLLLITDNLPPQESTAYQRICQLQETYQEMGVSCTVARIASTWELEKALVGDSFNMVFSNIYHVCNELHQPVNIHRILEQKQIPYIGSSSRVMEIVLHKSELKSLWQRSGVRTPGYLPVQMTEVAQKYEIPGLTHLDRYPYLVKPDAEGNSRGIDQSAIADTYPKLQQLIRRRLPQYASLLVEEFLGDRDGIKEFTVVMIGNGTDALYLPGEIQILVPQTRRIISTVDKDTHRTRIEPVEEQILPELIEFARKAFQSAGISDYGRLDILKSRKEFYAIEINGQPMLPDRWFDGCASYGGMTRKQYCSFILAQSQQRWKNLGVQI